MLEKIIEYIIITAILGGAVEIIRRGNKRSSEGNKEMLGSISSDIKSISNDVKELSKELMDIRVELPDKYLKISDFEKFKDENRDAHKELRVEMHGLISK
jgi:hypothetical protein